MKSTRVTLPDVRRKLAIIPAALGGHAATVTELQALGADVKAADKDGLTAVKRLIPAAMGGHAATMKELHALGADVKAADKDGLTAGPSWVQLWEGTRRR